MTLIMRTILVIGLALLIGVAGCKDKDGASGAPAASGSAAGAGGGGGGGGATTKLTQAQLDEAYKLADPDKIDKSLKDVTAKLGAPTKVEGDASIWYGVGKDGKTCYQLKISKTKGVDSGTTDKASCGLK
jgi:hypothetical protein